MAYETVIRMIRKEVNEMKAELVVLKAEVEELKKPKPKIPPVGKIVYTKGGKK